MAVRWTALVLTCNSKRNSYAYQKELEARQNAGLIDKETILLTIEDPVAGVGSGGATINALLVITEHLTAKAGFTVVNSDVLNGANILIMHMGRQYAFSACGRAFLSLPGSHSDTTTPLDHLINMMSTKIAIGSPSGVWVCSTDMILKVPDDFSIDWSSMTEVDVIGLSVPGDVSAAERHGVYVSDSQGMVTDILYKRNAEAIQLHVNKQGQANLVVGVVYFNKKATEKLVSFHTMTPLNSCTYVGVDSGAEAIEVSLFFDIVLAMCAATSRKAPIREQKAPELYQGKWNLLRKLLSNLTVKSVSVENGEFHYLFEDGKTLETVVCSFNSSHVEAKNEPHQHVVNSVVDAALPNHCLIMHSKLSKNVCFGTGVILSGVDFSTETLRGVKLCLQDRMIIQHIRVTLNADQQYTSRVSVIFGLDDQLNLSYEDPCSTFCHQTWSEFFERTGIQHYDLWPSSVSDTGKTLRNARLFTALQFGAHSDGDEVLMWMQGGAVSAKSLDRWRSTWRMSLDNILRYVNLNAEFDWRLSLFTDVTMLTIEDTLVNQKEKSLISLYKNVCSNRSQDCQKLLNKLDDVAMKSKTPGAAARTLANIADMLGCMAGGRGGIRSGPSANIHWQAAYNILEEGRLQDGVCALAIERRKWLRRSDQLIRAARHYEGAAQILIRQAVMTARRFIKLKKIDKIAPIGRWIVGECPARIDIAGGWSDTPPISYEHGGAVTNAAVTVDGKRPIGSKVKRLQVPHIVLVLNSGCDSTTLTITELHQLADYCQPQSPGALLKAAFCCADIVNLNSNQSLCEQLISRYEGGFELHTWSTLPHGSGLGTSSILAGVAMAVLWRVSGQMYSDESLIHAVLHLEQMMTTGGGWQDQVGGLLPGVKLGYSAATLPLYVQWKILDISNEVLKKFNDRLLLVYTGKTRLARNLLQNVIRNWYARDPYIVETEDKLVALAHECTLAFEQGDLVHIGECWTRYWELKKRMATGCEPTSVSRMIAALTPHIYCACMAGAGGGGFLYLLTKQANAKTLVGDILETLEISESYSIHEASIDDTGLTLYEE